jgi:hypothetical protein
MSSPSRHQNESIGSPAVTYEARSGSQLPAVHELRVAGAALEPPQQYSKAQVFALLVDALASFPADRRPHPAAGVGARMRRIDPGFTQVASGFPTFRDVVRAAVDAQYIRVEAAEGHNDISIDLAPGVSAGSTPQAGRVLERINSDLWRAMLSWNVGKSYVFDRATRRPIALSAPATESDLPLPVVTREQQLDWMRQFSATEGDSVIREALLTGLASDEPVRGFSAVMREEHGVDRRWKRYLRTRVLDRATEWARAAGIPFEDLEGTPRPSEPLRSEARNATPAQDEREQILALLALLPTSELLRLPVPVEYALKR